MRFRGAVFALLFVGLLAPAARSQGRAIELTADMLDRWFTAREKQKAEEKAVEPQLADVDARAKKYAECKRDFEAGGSVIGGGLGRLAARGGIKAKCGGTDESGFQKERQKITEGPMTAAAGAGGFKLDEYRTLSSRLESYLGGDESGFSKAGLDLLKSRRKALAMAFGMPEAFAELAGAASGGRVMGGGMGRGRGPDVWNTDYAWIWISQLFTVQYLSGATMFEKDYKPGEWTRWSITTADNEGESQVTERAFLGKASDGGEWWRMKTITNYLEDGKVTSADTVTLEALFKPEDQEGYFQKLVRMRGKLPGNAEAQEMLVPEQWTMWNMRGPFQMKPTPESVEGATVGMEDVTTPAGSFKARHVRFGQGGGTIDWWLDDTVVGGWVKFAALDNEKNPMYTMQLVGKGTGAKSELGVTIK
jgi:hypothetical protein